MFKRSGAAVVLAMVMLSSPAFAAPDFVQASGGYIRMVGGGITWLNYHTEGLASHFGSKEREGLHGVQGRWVTGFSIRTDSFLIRPRGSFTYARGLAQQHALSDGGVEYRWKRTTDRIVPAFGCDLVFRESFVSLGAELGVAYLEPRGEGISPSGLQLRSEGVRHLSARASLGVRLPLSSHWSGGVNLFAGALTVAGALTAASLGPSGGVELFVEWESIDDTSSREAP